MTVTPGAQIPATDEIFVGLASRLGGNGQVFAAQYQGGATDDVNYLVKINNDTPISNTTDFRIGLTLGYDVILVDAATAHASGATGAINVGFETTPYFKYSGVYSQPVAFTVGVLDTTPVPIT